MALKATAELAVEQRDRSKLKPGASETWMVTVEETAGAHKFRRATTVVGDEEDARDAAVELGATDAASVQVSN